MLKSVVVILKLCEFLGVTRITFFILSCSRVTYTFIPRFGLAEIKVDTNVDNVDTLIKTEGHKMKSKQDLFLFHCRN